MGTRNTRKRKTPSTIDASSTEGKECHPLTKKYTETTTHSSALPIHSKLVIILSPAKTLDTTPMIRNEYLPWTTPNCDSNKTKELAHIMKQQSTSSLKKLLGISDNLAKTAKQYWDDMTEKSSSGKPCIFAFQGAAYQGLAIDTIPDMSSALNYLQDTLRIVDPLYGWLRPMDEIQPYRLEMATRNVLPEKQKLVDFWKPAIQESIRNEGKDVLILNLASDEYSIAVQHPHMIKVVFRHGGRVIAIHAKRARGLMVRYCAIHNVSNIAQLKNFAEEGYRYQSNQSEDDDTTLVFDRSKNWNEKRSST